MKQFVMVCCVLLLTSCVTKGRYEKVLSSVKSKEKQQIRLEKELEELRNLNQKLRDSADRMGG